MNNYSKWDILLIPPEGRLSAILADKGNALKYSWAKNHYGEKILLVEGKLQKHFNNSDFNFKYIDLIPFKEGIQIILKNEEHTEIFENLCKDLIRSTKGINSEQKAINSLLLRIKKWQKLLSSLNRYLDKNFLKGLVGELLFIKKLLGHFDRREVLDFWKSPTEESVHDFIVNDTAIEIKTKTSKNIINISSYEQMFTELPKLYLYVYTLSECDRNKGFNIYDIIGEIKKLLSDEYLIFYFERLLVDYGFVSLKEYNEVYFSHIKEEAFKVGEGFPKIEKKSDAVINLKYSIKIDKIEEFKIEEKDMF
ncbi:conserved hypothetical protein [Lebetimonas natsushimae]|uniref:PD-(D/E)XK motif protein n=1 Tax=Lebetimonas natsushimae TaxID=1936991 RepID=A0A292YBY5_9BACT|nr:PD-(D/E)XK motif protein [Lebetimonas natsushimae]GAX87023.1 conserved hypothetical protein [Lebetimonas natsushimae]